MPREPLPLAGLEALFLDAGNTIVGWDHDFVEQRARSAGFVLDPQRLVRFEAAARPRLDAILRRGRSTEAPDTMAVYLQCILDVGLAADLPTADHPRFVAEMSTILRSAEGSDRLWSRVAKGLPEELARLRDAGVACVVVSNSDGTCARKLEDAGVRHFFDAVIDSAVVGVEKPDPEIFRVALRHGGYAPERTLHVGDLHAIDVRGAEGAGLHAALLDPFDDWAEVDCARYPDVATLVRAILRARGV